MKDTFFCILCVNSAKLSLFFKNIICLIFFLNLAQTQCSNYQGTSTRSYIYYIIYSFLTSNPPIYTIMLFKKNCLLFHWPLWIKFKLKPVIDISNMVFFLLLHGHKWQQMIYKPFWDTLDYNVLYSFYLQSNQTYYSTW